VRSEHIADQKFADLLPREGRQPHEIVPARCAEADAAGAATDVGVPGQAAPVASPPWRALIIISAILGRTQGSPLPKSPGCAVGAILVIALFWRDRPFWPGF
jgi:hypothetical protein